MRSVPWSAVFGSRSTARSARRSTGCSSCTPEPEPERFVALDAAVAHATDHLHQRLTAELAAAGAHVFEVSSTFAEQVVEVSGTPMFVEGVLTMTGSGRPDLGR